MLENLFENFIPFEPGFIIICVLPNVTVYLYKLFFLSPIIQIMLQNFIPQPGVEPEICGAIICFLI